jgi:signal transduction histidine kinase
MLELRRRIRSTYLWAWDHSIWIAMVLIVLIIGAAVIQADQAVRNDLHLAVLNAATDAGAKLRNYEAQHHYTDRKIIELSEADVQKSVRSWTPITSHISLEVLSKNSLLLYDSRDKSIHLYDASAAPSDAPWYSHITSHFHRPFWTGAFYTVQQPITDNWTLQTVITGENYLREIGRHLAVAFLGCVAIIILFAFPTYYRTTLTFRHYEQVVVTLLADSSGRETVEEFVTVLPQLVRKALYFDSCKVYLLRGGKLDLGASDPQPSEKQEISIDCDGDCFEATAARQRLPMVLNHPKGIKRVEARTAMRSHASGSMPYVAVPIIDPQEDVIIGLLTAEKPFGFEESHVTELHTLMRLVMVLYNNARATFQLNAILSRMIHQTREVALGTVVPILAHNLLGPLSAVEMIARDVAKKLAGSGREAIETQMRQVAEQMEQCGAVIERINAYRTIGANADPNLPSKPTDLVDVLKTICAFFGIYFQTQHIRLETNFEEDFNPIISIDEVDLLQVISNLFRNCDQAFKEARPKGTDATVTLTVMRDGERGVRVRVSDNGPGIPLAWRDKIFQPNFTTKAKGTGAGLPYCRNVIHDIGGTLELVAQDGPGATFNIDLPQK